MQPIMHVFSHQIETVEICLSSSTSYDRHLKARTQVLALAALTVISAFIFYGLFLGNMASAFVKFTLGNQRQARVSASLAVQQGKAAVVAGLVVLSTGYLFLMPSKTSLLYQSLGLYRSVPRWRRIAEFMAVLLPSLAFLYVVSPKHSAITPISPDSQLTALKIYFGAFAAFLLNGAPPYARYAYYWCRNRPRGPRTGEVAPGAVNRDSAPGTIGADPNVREHLINLMKQNPVTKNLWERAQDNLTKMNGKQLDIAIIGSLEGSRSGAHCNYKQGRIEITASFPRDMAEEYTIFELCNMYNASAFENVYERSAYLSMEEYGNHMELIEVQTRDMCNEIVTMAKKEDPHFPIKEMCRNYNRSSGTWITDYLERCPKRTHIYYYYRAWLRAHGMFG